MGFFQFLTTGFMLSINIGARNTVPSSMARMVPIGALPHIVQVIFAYALFVGRNCRTFNAYAIAFDGVARFDRNLIACFIALDKTQIVILRFEIHKRQKQFILNHLPDDTGHFVAVHLHERRRHFNLFGQCTIPFLTKSYIAGEISPHRHLLIRAA